MQYDFSLPPRFFRINSPSPPSLSAREGPCAADEPRTGTPPFRPEGGVRLQIRLQFLLFSGAGRCTVGYNHRTVITAQTAGITRKNPAALENQRPRESSRQSVLRASLRLAPKARPEPGASYGLLGRAAFGGRKTKRKTRSQRVFLEHRNTIDTAFRFVPKTKSKPSAADSIWRGAATK